MSSFFTPKWVSIFALFLIVAGLFFEHTYEVTVMIGSLLLAMWLAIALHELGHIIFGKLSGFDFAFFTVGPFQLEKSLDGINLKENKHWLFFGGVAMMMPPYVEKEALLKKWATFVAGGPVLSLLLGSVSFILYTQFSYTFLINFAIMNGGILLATIIPFKTSMRTDGYVLLSLLKNTEESLLLIEELLILKQLLGRKQPTEWNTTYIQLAKQKEATIENLQYAMMIYYFEIENSNFQSAVEAMSGYSAIPITKKNKLPLGFIIHMQQLSHFLKEDVQIEKIVHLQQLLSSIEPVSFHRGKTLIAHLQNDKESALQHLKKVNDIIEQNKELYGFYMAEQTLTNLVEEKMAN